MKRNCEQYEKNTLWQKALKERIKHVHIVPINYQQKGIFPDQGECGYLSSLDL